MKDRPIPFTASMVQAILSGRKTQTRRLIKPEWSRCLDLDDPDDLAKAIKLCPYGQPGDRLWVKETWAYYSPTGFVYKADFEDDGFGAEIVEIKTGKLTPLIWKPSRFMPWAVSRITLDIVKVRVERLQDIDDVLAEGCPALASDEDGSELYEWFSDLWDSIYEKRGYSWESNPWVWVIEFKQHIKEKQL